MTRPDSVTLFGHWICPFSVRVEFALAQRTITYEVVEVPPTAVRPKGFVVPREFIDHSPKLEVPMVRVGDQYLADSIPILEWLEARFSTNPLLPTGDDDRDRVRERMRWLDRHLYRPMIGVYYGTDPHKIADSSAAFGVAMETVSGWLGSSPWLAGEQPTLVEAIMAGVYTRLDGLQRLGLTSHLPGLVERHMSRMADLPGWPSVEWSKDQTDEFVSRFDKYRQIKARSGDGQR